MDLRKATNHPLLLRHHYTDHTLHCMVRDILKESSHTDAAPNLVWEDMSVMSDLSYTTTVQGVKCEGVRVCGCLVMYRIKGSEMIGFVDCRVYVFSSSIYMYTRTHDALLLVIIRRCDHMLRNAHVHTYVVTIRIRPTQELGGNVRKI